MNALKFSFGRKKIEFPISKLLKTWFNFYYIHNLHTTDVDVKRCAK